MLARTRPLGPGAAVRGLRGLRGPGGGLTASHAACRPVPPQPRGRPRPVPAPAQSPTHATRQGTRHATHRQIYHHAPHRPRHAMPALGLAPSQHQSSDQAAGPGCRTRGGTCSLALPLGPGCRTCLPKDLPLGPALDRTQHAPKLGPYTCPSDLLSLHAHTDPVPRACPTCSFHA